jgi:fatty acid desaturase
MATKVETLTETDVGKKRVQCLDDFVNSDLHEPRLEYIFHTPIVGPAMERLLKDKRDVPMLSLQLNIMEYLIPGTLFLYYINMMENAPPLYVRNILGLIFMLGNVILFEERFILMLHYSAHRPIYKNSILNSYVNWMLTPFYGMPCGVYKLHHVVMHHIENNHELDISCTEFYQRDSFFAFLRYYLRFACLIYLELPLYCIKTKRWQWMRRSLAGVTIWVSMIIFLAKMVNFWATFWVFIMPIFVCFLALSFGNWSQHIFVDPTRPENNYALTYNCIDIFVNRRTFNDGYHVIHHYGPMLHWSELAEHFHSEEVRTRHYKEGALTFRGVHFFDVGMHVMTGRLRRLAEYYVHLGPKEEAPTVEEVEEKMKSWLVAMPAVKGNKGGLKKAE